MLDRGVRGCGLMVLDGDLNGGLRMRMEMGVCLWNDVFLKHVSV